MIRNITIITALFISILVSRHDVAAQNRLVDQVKQDVNSVSLTVDNYKDAISKIEPALSNEETKDDAEAWFTAGKLNFGLYDKCLKVKSVGEDVDEALMYSSLIDGYNKMRQALMLDSVVVRDKEGNPKLEKSGKPKIKTKFSKKIIEIVKKHYDDYRLAGGVFYVKQNNYESAYNAWLIYTTLPFMSFSNRKDYHVNDTTIGKYCYMQGIAAKMMDDNTKALDSFLQAIKLGYIHKDVFDFAISCAESNGDGSQLVELVKDAYDHFGKEEPKYIIFLINYAITNKLYDEATRVIDMAIAEYPNNAEYYDLKGVLIESQTDDIGNAYEYYRKCLEIDPNHVRGNFDVGRYYYNEALKAEKDSDTTAEEILEKFGNAKPYFEKAYEADPNNSAARDALKNIYYHLGDAEKLERLEQLEE